MIRYPIAHEGYEYLPGLKGYKQPEGPDVCFKCGKGFESYKGDLLPSYGYDDQAHRLCYNCCAAVEREDMALYGEAPFMYLKKVKSQSEVYSAGIYFVTNFTGEISFPCYGSHRSETAQGFWWGERIDVWFTGPDGKPWHGVHYGDNDLVRCRRLKNQSRRFRIRQ